jgi:hypothetical protein
MNPRKRGPLYGVAALLALLLGGIAVFAFIQNSRVTAEKIEQYVQDKDFAALSGADRSERLRQLANMVNALSIEERRKWWLSGAWRKWFDAMNEREKGQYLDATMPTGFKQMLNVFEELPEARRKKFMDDAMKQLVESHRMTTDHEPGRETSMYGTNEPPVLTPDLEKRARTIGLKTFYTESSAQTKAELSPFLEELQHQMERGKVAFR